MKNGIEAASLAASDGLREAVEAALARRQREDGKRATISTLAHELGIARESISGKLDNGRGRRRGLSPTVVAQILDRTDWPINKRVTLLSSFFASSPLVPSLALAEILREWMDVAKDQETAWKRLLAILERALEAREEYLADPS